MSFTKGCYVGQETVARLFYRGKPNRHLRGLRLSEPAPVGRRAAPRRARRRPAGELGRLPRATARSRSRSCAARPPGRHGRRRGRRDRRGRRAAVRRQLTAACAPAAATNAVERRARRAAGRGRAPARRWPASHVCTIRASATSLGRQAARPSSRPPGDRRAACARAGRRPPSSGRPVGDAPAGEPERVEAPRVARVRREDEPRARVRRGERGRRARARAPRSARGGGAATPRARSARSAAAARICASMCASSAAPPSPLPPNRPSASSRRRR